MSSISTGWSLDLTLSELESFGVVVYWKELERVTVHSTQVTYIQVVDPNLSGRIKFHQSFGSLREGPPSFELQSLRCPVRPAIDLMPAKA
jgi:hypothetical protein